MTERVGPNTCGTWFILKASRTNGKPFLQKFGEGKIIVLFQIFRIFLLDLCVPKYGDHSPKIGDHSLSRPLVTLHLRGSRPSDPRFLLFAFCFLFVFSFNIIPRTVYLFSYRFFFNTLVLFFVYTWYRVCQQRCVAILLVPD